MKFMTLLKKELREMLSISTIIGMVVAMGVFMLLGQVMSGIAEDSQSKAASVHLIDEDNSNLSQACVNTLSKSGIEVIVETPDPSAEGALQYKPQGDYDLVVIPKGFEESILNGEKTDVDVYTSLTSLSMSSMMSSSGSTAAVAVINETVSAQLLSQSLAEGVTASPDFLKNPVTTGETTFVADKSAEVSANALAGFAMNQSMFVPIVVFILVIFASQMVASAIANEKGDKTLETLLCTPVSRLSVLSAKMCGAGLVSLLMAAVYMLGFSSYMNGMMGGSGTGTSQVLGDSLNTLGISLSVTDYVMLGVQLFLTILIALAISLILGALATDVKSAQTAIMPLMFAMLIPYMMSMFTDIRSFALPLQLLIYAIPFTHTFIANSNLIFDNYPLYFGGLIYQVIFLAVVMFLAVKLFSGDRIFTIRLNFGKKKRKALPSES